MTHSVNPGHIDIMIGGVQKAATSSLLHYMSEHPDVISNPDKEFTFFIIDEEWKQGYDKRYFIHFGKRVDHSKKVLAKNAGVIYFEQGMIHLKEHNPHAKIIIVLRNPVDRAYSAFWYARSKGHENLESFDEALHADLNRAAKPFSRGIIDYIGRGDYAHQIERLYTYFDKKNVLILLQEDLQSNIKEVIKNVFTFCNLDASFIPDLSKEYNESSRAVMPAISNLLSSGNAVKHFIHKILPDGFIASVRLRIRSINKVAFTPPPMNSETRKELIEFFKPKNEALEKLIGRNLSNWNK